jgi:rhamnosyltransferase
MSVSKVAVLLPIYNSSKFIIAQLGSIFSQQNVEVDVYIYDDGSSDNAVAEINNVFSKSNIFYIKNSSSFGSASLSFLHLIRTVDLSGYDYVSLSDHDDIWSSYKLSSAIDDIKNTNSDAFSSSVLSINITKYGYKNPFLVKKHKAQRKYDYLFEGPGPGCTFVLSSGFIANFKSFLMNITVPLDDLRWHDWFLYYYARMNKFSWFISSSSNMLYCQWGTNDTGVNKGMSAFIERFSWVFSGWYFEQSRFMYNIIKEYSDCADEQVSFESFKFWLFNALSLRRSMIGSVFFCIAAIINIVKRKLK